MTKIKQKLLKYENFLKLIENFKEIIQDFFKPYNSFKRVFFYVVVLFGLVLGVLRYIFSWDISNNIITFNIYLFFIAFIGIILSKFTLSIQEHMAEIIVFSFIIALLEYGNPENTILIVASAALSILYSKMILWEKEDYDKEQIKSKYESKLKEIHNVEKINTALNKIGIWQAACLLIYIQQRINDIKLFIRAPDDLPKEKFNPSKGEPNIFDQISVELDDDKKYIEQILIESMDKRNRPILNKLKNGGKFEDKDREEFAKMVSEIANQIDEPDFASYCYQLVKMVYWKQFYDIGNETFEKAIEEKFEKFRTKIKIKEIIKPDKFKIWDNMGAYINYVKKFPLQRIISTEDRNILNEDILKCEFDEKTYSHTITFYDYPNLHLLQNRCPYSPPKGYFFAPQFSENFPANYGDIWITKDVINEHPDALEYMMTLGGTLLLKEDISFINKIPKLYIQHPFQEKVFVELMNHQNYAYPSEIIKNWKNWMTSDIEKKRFVWIREGVQPVANKIKITKEVIQKLEEKYEKKCIDNLKEYKQFKDNLYTSIKDENHLLFFQIHDQFVRTPTTAIIIITIEKEGEESSLFKLAEKFKDRQDDLKEIFDALQKTHNNKDVQYLWKEQNDTVHSFSDPDTWIHLGVLGIIAREVKCCYGLLKIIDHYLDKKELKIEERKKLKASKEEIYDYLEKEYLDWLSGALKTLYVNKSAIVNIVNNRKSVNDKLDEILKYLGKLEVLHKKNGDICILKHKIWKEIKNYGNKPRC